MKQAFREALIQHVRMNQTSLAQLARTTGVSKHLIDALHQRKTMAPNVHDAQRLAAFYGKTIEQFIGQTPSDTDERLKGLIVRLSAEEAEMLEVQLQTLLQRRRAKA